MQDWVERAKAGDLDAFGALIDRYKDMVYGTAYAILGNFHDAQDASQEAFLRAWQRLKTLRDNRRFPGWLYRTTRNLSLGRLRAARDRTGPIDDVADALPDSRAANPRRRAEQAELRHAVLEAVRSLSEPNRLATTLFYIDGYSIEEVADFLEVPPGTVKRRLHDSRNRLRERMVDMVEDAFKSNALPGDFSGEILRKIGDYACLNIIGAGPMGSVYRAEHPVLKREVAIKIASEPSPGLAKVWQTGRATLEKLNHPGFVKILSHGQHDGRPYVVMEYLKNSMNLQGWMATPHSLHDVLRMLARLAEAAVHAHGRGVVIGCITPIGVIVVPDGDPVIVDAPSSPTVLRTTSRQAGVHWLACLPPECANGEPPDKLSDIWSLGVIMYELLAGIPLFAADSEEEMLQALQSSDPVNLSPLKGRVPDYVVSVLEKCLAKAPQDRLQSAAELLFAIEEAQFADLVRLPDYDAQRLLLDVEPHPLADALAGAGDDVTTHLLRHLRHKTAGEVRRRMPENPPGSQAAHAARLEILRTADRLLSEQRIAF